MPPISALAVDGAVTGDGVAAAAAAAFALWVVAVVSFDFWIARGNFQNHAET